MHKGGAVAQSVNRPAIFAAFAALVGAALLLGRRGEGVEEVITLDDDGGTDTGNSFTLDALQDIKPGQLPTVDAGREARNVEAFKAVIKAAEGTAKAGGYGALFGWPMAGRSFDPLKVDGHPKQFFTYVDKAGKSLRTSAAGAYQITYTTWLGYQVPFRAWAVLNGYSVSGFTPQTQDAFAVFLLDLDGALSHVKAGRLSQALAVARGRWASLPGAGVNQPERSQQFVLNAYKQAGGALA